MSTDPWDTTLTDQFFMWLRGISRAHARNQIGPGTFGRALQERFFPFLNPLTEQMDEEWWENYLMEADIREQLEFEERDVERQLRREQAEARRAERERQLREEMGLEVEEEEEEENGNGDGNGGNTGGMPDNAMMMMMMMMMMGGGGGDSGGMSSMIMLPMMMLMMQGSNIFGGNTT